jgi:hypothetical protein
MAQMAEVSANWSDRKLLADLARQATARQRGLARNTVLVL